MSFGAFDVGLKKEGMKMGNWELSKFQHDPYVAVNKTSSLQIIKYRPSQRTKASEKHDICRNKGGKMVHFLPSVGGREEKKKKPMFQHGA